jgi:propanol-preferring alcohol dehydrogenase
MLKIMQIGGLVTVEEIDVPKPGPRQVLIKLAAASLCSTDISVIDGMFGPQLFPVILGHEAVGVIVELGPGSDSYGLQVGQVIGSPPYMDMCLECQKCKAFGPDFCSKKKVKGISAPGYFAEYSLVDAASAVIVADQEADVGNIKQVSPIFCAGATVWDALERGDIKPGQTVAIIGLGGLGQLAARYANGLGAKVIALDVQQDQLDAVKGFTHGTVNISNLQPLQVNGAISGLNNGHGADVVIVTAGVASAYQTALSIAEPLGRIVVVGLPKEPLSIHAGLLSGNCHK